MKKILFWLAGSSFFSLAVAQGTSFEDTCKFRLGVWAPYWPKTCVVVVNSSQSTILQLEMPDSFPSYLKFIYPERVGDYISGVADKDINYADMTVTIKKWPEDTIFFTGSVKNYQAISCDDTTCKVTYIPHDDPGKFPE